jgi:DNA/RNA endonuclease G (NUC1)
MRRLLRSSGMAIGLLAAFAFCAPDRQLSPTVGPRNVASLEASSSPAIVISQIYGGGGNAGATLKSDFIELFNPGTQAVPVDGWSVQYASSAGSSWQVTPLSGTIPAGRYYLVKEASGAGGTVDLPTPDKIGTIAMALGAGKVVIATQTAALAGTCPVAATIDRVGYGATNCATDWVGNAPALSNTTAALRKDDGCTYTGNPATDFVSGTPNPRNSLSSPRSCVVQVVEYVTIEPTDATIVEGNTKQFLAKAFDEDDQELSGVAFAWASSNTDVATVNGAGLATGVAPGDVEITVAAGGEDATATLHVDEAPLPNLPAVRFSELHYDNVGTDVGEAVEIEGPAGTNLAGWKVVLYNGNGGAAYDTRELTETIPSMCDGRGVVVVRYEQDGVQNGDRDGFALVDAAGQLVEFLSYEGILTAVDGPAAGQQSMDIGVKQDPAPGLFRTLQRKTSGRWEGPNASTLGDCYGRPVTETNQISFSGRLKTDAELPVGFEDQLFGTLRSPTNATIETAISWQSLNPNVASIDADGVMHALAPGFATVRAMAEDGTTATFTLPMIVAAPSATAQYANHAEFGEPADGDASDDFLVRRTEFTSSFNRNRNIPNWVTYNLEATHIVPGQDRCDCFTYDPLLPADFRRYTTADYTGVGGATPFHGYAIDRGHLVRSFDRTAGALDNARTFYFSNVIPQAADNNQGPWANLENYLGGLAQNQNKEVYVITGPAGSKGTLKDEGLVTIPEWTWKVAVIMPRNQGRANVQSYGDLEVVAVIMPNIAGIRTPPGTPDAANDWKKYVTTVNAVEALTGYDVLALLEKKIESVVEAGMQDEMALVDGLVETGKISKGNGNSLTSKLEAAAGSLDRGNVTAAVNQLEAFLHEVDAMEKSKRLDAVEANALRSAIMALIASVSS